MVDALVDIAIDWMASETLRDARQREIGRAWCALMGAAHGRDGMGDVYSRMINVAMVYMHSVLCGIVIQNDPCGSGWMRGERGRRVLSGMWWKMP